MLIGAVATNELLNLLDRYSGYLFYCKRRYIENNIFMSLDILNL